MGGAAQGGRCPSRAQRLGQPSGGLPALSPVGGGIPRLAARDRTLRYSRPAGYPTADLPRYRRSARGEVAPSGDNAGGAVVSGAARDGGGRGGPPAARGPT